MVPVQVLSTEHQPVQVLNMALRPVQAQTSPPVQVRPTMVQPPAQVPVQPVLRPVQVLLHQPVPVPVLRPGLLQIQTHVHREVAVLLRLLQQQEAIIRHHQILKGAAVLLTRPAAVAVAVAALLPPDHLLQEARAHPVIPVAVAAVAADKVHVNLYTDN